LRTQISSRLVRKVESSIVSLVSFLNKEEVRRPITGPISFLNNEEIRGLIEVVPAHFFSVPDTTLPMP
jgi:hypothetical protein